MKKVYFYSDKLGHTMPEREFLPILKQLRATIPEFLCAEQTRGFESGISWEKLNGMAVVLYDTNDAAVYGICLEIEMSSDLEVYEYFEGKLFRLRNLEITGKEEVSDLMYPEPALQSA